MRMFHVDAAALARRSTPQPVMEGRSSVLVQPHGQYPAGTVLHHHDGGVNKDKDFYPVHQWDNQNGVQPTPPISHTVPAYPGARPTAGMFLLWVAPDDTTPVGQVQQWDALRVSRVDLTGVTLEDVDGETVTYVWSTILSRVGGRAVLVPDWVVTRETEEATTQAERGEIQAEVASLTPNVIDRDAVVAVIRSYASRLGYARYGEELIGLLPQPEQPFSFTVTVAITDTDQGEAENRLRDALGAFDVVAITRR